MNTHTIDEGEPVADLDLTKRVALRRAPQFVGTVQGRVIKDIAYIKFEWGGAGNFHTDDLVQAPEGGAA